MNQLRIAQITDIHIGPEDVLYNNINVRKNFLKTLEDVQKRDDIDLIVFSGDLAIDFGEMEAYLWIQEQLVNVEIPYLFMAGNHDSVERMQKVFKIDEYVKNGMLYYEYEMKGHRLYFLDSEPNRLHREQLDWLEMKTKENEAEALLFIHHPPSLMDCKFMDINYPLRNIAEVQGTLSEIKNIKHIFAGHYHCAIEKDWEEKRIYVAPATQMQINKLSETFVLETTQPGYRLIEWNGTELKTEVVWP